MLKNLFSIDEMRVSSLILIMFATFGFALRQYYIQGDIGSNILSLLIALVTAVAGMNLGNMLVSGLGDKRENDPEKYV